MKNWKSLKLTLPVLALMLSVHAVFAQSPAPQTNSASGLQKSGTGVGSPHVSKGSTSSRALPYGRATDTDVISACAAAVEDLRATRGLAEALERENTALIARLEIERQSVGLLTELNETRRSETEALRGTVAAKNEAIAAKDALITSQEKLIEALKKKKSSPWKRLGDVLIGAAVIAVLK